MNLTNERKLELTIDALLNKCEGLEKSIEYLRGETAQAWTTAKKWKEEDEIAENNFTCPKNLKIYSFLCFFLPSCIIYTVRCINFLINNVQEHFLS